MEIAQAFNQIGAIALITLGGLGMLSTGVYTISILIRVNRRRERSLIDLQQAANDDMGAVLNTEAPALTPWLRGVRLVAFWGWSAAFFFDGLNQVWQGSLYVGSWLGMLSGVFGLIGGTAVLIFRLSRRSPHTENEANTEQKAELI